MAQEEYVEKVVIKNERAERAVIGACLIDPEKALMCDELDESHFMNRHLGQIWREISRVSKNGGSVDPLTISRRLNGDSSLDELVGLMSNVSTSAHAEHYAREVKLTAARRQLAQAAAKIMQLSHDFQVDDPVTEAQSILANLEDTSGSTKLISSADAWSDFLEDYERRAKGEIDMISTGFRDLDKILDGGLEEDKFYIIAARPSMGKSTLAQQFAEAAIQQDKHVMYVALEAGVRSMIRRTVTRKSGMSREQIMNGENMREVVNLAGQKAQDKIHYLDDPKVKTSQIAAHLKRLQAQGNPVDLLVVDYAQLCQDLPELKSYERQTQVSIRLKQIKSEFKIPVVIVAQLSRKPEERSDKRPLISDLKETGQYEQDADVVMLLYREAYYSQDAVFENNNAAEVNVAKNREGPTGMVQLVFIPETVSFFGLEHGQKPQGS